MTDPVPDADGATGLGLAALQAGDLATAEAWYRRALVDQPGHFDALHLLGVTHIQRGRLALAARLIRSALGVNPRFALAQSNLGNCLWGMGQPGEALAQYDRALSIQPDFIDALGNRGGALHDLGRLSEALASFQSALAVLPNAGSVFRNRAGTLAASGRGTEALASYDRALTIEPGDVDALIGRGLILRSLGRRKDALASFDSVLAKQAKHVAALWHRGIVLKDLGRPDEALASFDRALEINPNHVDVLNNRGALLLELKRPEEALACFDRALEVAPAGLNAINNRGVALSALRRQREARAAFCQSLALVPALAEAMNNHSHLTKDFDGPARAVVGYTRALAIKPDYADALHNRGTTLRELGRYGEAIADFGTLARIDPDWPFVEGYLLESQMTCCDWRDFEQRSRSITSAARQGKPAATPFSLFSITGSEQDQAACAEVYCRRSFVSAPAPLWRGERYGHDRIRVAYLSADLREHAISYLLAGLFERHDRRRFEIIAVSFGPAEPSPMRTRLKGAFDRFVDVSEESDRGIAALVRRLEVDIAVDLMGHTYNNRLGVFAHRPAPVSVNFFCPTGAPFIDYLFADRIAIAEESRQFHREAVAYLPDTFLATDCTRPIAERTPSRGELGLPEGAFVFCSFNNTYKINPAIFDIWMRLLRQVEGSVLWLRHYNVPATENLRREAARRGVDPGRLVFAPRLPSMAEHLARYRQADLFLDTLPFNAQTTAVDALWAGLPILTCLGTTFVGRVAASLLHAIGLPELIVGSPADYEALALALARDGGKLGAIRARLARHRDTHPLFDTDRYRRHVESAYVTMWERAQGAAPPESFAVPPQP